MYKQKQAFTLVELIVVITILAILGTIAFISLQGYSKDARDSTRVSDIGNIKTSLELFSLAVGEYPMPDNAEEVSYSGDTLWYQGILGDNVTKNLRSLNKKPTDPLFGTEYIYSVTAPKKEYEILSLYEGDTIVRTNFISQTYAADNMYPRVDGTYNGVYIKTSNYIFPTPSLITSEEIGGIMEMNQARLESQVVTNGKNIPKFGGNASQTGSLNMTLSATGTITKDSTDAEKIAVIEAIQNAYSGSDLATQSTYAHILAQTSTQQILNLVNETVLDTPVQTVDIVCDEGYVEVSGSCVLDQCGGTIPDNAVTTALTQSAGSNWSYNATPGLCTFKCGDYTVWNSGNGTCDLDIRSVASCTSEGQRFLDSSTYGSCDLNNIIVCTGVGAGYIISACNLGTITSGLGEESYGNLYQWGNNGGLLYGDTTKQTSTYNASGYSASTFNIATFVYGSNLYGSEDTDWTTSQNNNLWGEVTNTSTARKGPCASGYHVPSIEEWVEIRTAGGWGTDSAKMSNDLKMPKAGYRFSGTAAYWQEGNYGYYWSSSSQYFNSTYGYMSPYISLNPTNITCSRYTVAKRAMGYNVRCIKN